LYISRKIIEAHGGRISVQSPPPDAAQGAIFTFSLPAMPDRVPTRPTPVPLAIPPNGPKILVVEDEPDFQTVLRVLLAEEGYRVELATNGQTALDIVQTDPPDLVLLDWRLPGVDGLTVCRNLRRWSSVPIVMVTSKTAQEDILAAFDAGADDYITKPFVGEELLARTRALLRRGDAPARVSDANQFITEGLTIDFDTRAVWRKGQPVALTATEFDLLAALVRHPRQVLTYAQLVDQVWGTEEGTRHALSVHISRLRNKIERDAGARFIQTKWGIGYLFTP
jgi:DNA-binding response OmpR family regulator